MMDPIEEPGHRGRVSHLAFYLAWAGVGAFVLVGIAAMLGAMGVSG